MIPIILQYMKEIRGWEAESFFREKCHEYNHRVTPQRLAIFKLVHTSRDHPNTDVIFRQIRKRFSNISFDTVNRTLLSFARIGILKVVEGYGNPNRFDPMLKNHHHFHCVQCNRIIDFYGASVDEIDIPETIAQQYTIIDKKLVIEGICDRCRK